MWAKAITRERRLFIRSWLVECKKKKRDVLSILSNDFLHARVRRLLGTSHFLIPESKCLGGGAQKVTRHGKPVAVLVPADEYWRFRTGGRSFKALLASAPLVRGASRSAVVGASNRLRMYLISTNIVSAVRKSRRLALT